MGFDRINEIAEEVEKEDGSLENINMENLNFEFSQTLSISQTPRMDSTSKKTPNTRGRKMLANARRSRSGHSINFG